MRWFLDTEFYDTGTEIQLISIALVPELDWVPEYYAANLEFEPDECPDQWIHKNVIPQLPPAESEEWKTRAEIAADISFHLKTNGHDNQLWGYFSSYDFVILCQLYGGMLKLPPHIPHRCNDVAQLAGSRGVSKSQLPKQLTTAHNALNDARWTRDCYVWIVSQ